MIAAIAFVLLAVVLVIVDDWLEDRNSGRRDARERNRARRW